MPGGAGGGESCVWCEKGIPRKGQSRGFRAPNTRISTSHHTRNMTSKTLVRATRPTLIVSYTLEEFNLAGIPFFG